MTVEINKATAHSYFERLLNRGDKLTANTILAPGIRFHYPLGDLSGIDAVKQHIGELRTAFPDIRFTVADLFSEGDRAAVRWSMAGTQTGEFRGKAPTGKRVRVPGITILRIAEGQIQEAWIVFDPALLLNE